jgi:hypothetical protein
MVEDWHGHDVIGREIFQDEFLQRRAEDEARENIDGTIPSAVVDEAVLRTLPPRRVAAALSS